MLVNGNLTEELKIFTGNANPDLAKAVADYLKVQMGKCEVFQFSNENIFVRIQESVRQKDVYVIQPTCSPVNQSIMELLIMMDALKRASSERITAVLPYYGYGRTDKKDQPRVPITARLIADLLTTAGASRILTVDLHAPQIQGFFDMPVDELTAENLLANYFKKKKIEDLVVVATDVGISKKARDFAAKLDAPLAIIEKRRMGNNDITRTINIIGDVEGKNALTFDDEIDTAGSLVGNVNILISKGVKEVYSCATHPVLSGPAIQRIAASPIKELVVTDSIPLTPPKKIDKITILSIAPLIGEAIYRIHTGNSIGEMYDQMQME
ncbi:ribose-phosphate diphosphokinase [Dehalococcoides mccartyi]|uniref:Ribose-phosphate pyrophosphokinase n=1 Tax=Dehalococcoides mccartyi (strain VS) TaxID=311424 RepID=D2BGT3_DEHMV|nr:ribose-phosphate pyrophosphokinase [Dehalococcoides mccartyi]ACZ61533.1 ribose-phosphate pyrophosphokinase [Dehalococcoides mccartyi VS]